MVHQQSEQRHPFTAILLLLMLALTGAVLFTFISFLVGYLVYSPPTFIELINDKENIGFQKLALAFSSVGMFVLPPLYLAYLEKKNTSDYLKLSAPAPLYLIPLAILIMICATPFVEWTVYINEKMKLPGFLQPMEFWMRSKEDELALLTKKLLVMKTIPVLVINLVIIAIIPALGEELTFRACVQKLFTLWTNNYHVGIWLAAILFSTIHFQFYGFIPRMVLGALFGYLLVWTKSIWVPIAAHFYNNASAVLAAYSLQKEGKSLDTLTEPTTFKWYIVVLSVIFTCLLLWILKKNSLNKTPND